MSGRGINLVEYVASDSSLRVDLAGNCLRGVKVLGRRSRNNREYLESAIAGAQKLYESAKVYTDHPASSSHTRSVRELIGWLEGVRLQGGELYADLHLVHPKADTFVPKLLDLAARKPSLVGLSHNATGREQTGSGGTIIEAIDHVHSVDLVSDPATVNGIFESTTMTQKNQPKTAHPTAKAASKKTLREVLLASVVKPKVRAWLKEWDGGDMSADDGMYGTPGASGEDMDVAAAEPAHGEDLAQRICELIDSAGPTDEKIHNPKYLKFLERMKAMCEEFTQSEGGGEGEGDGEDEGGEIETEESRRRKKPAAGQTALQEEVARLKRREHVRDLAATAKYTPTAVQVNALTACGSDDEIKALLEDFKAAAASREGGGRAGGPRSASRQGNPTPPPPAAEKVPADAKGWLESVETRARGSRN